VLVEVKRDGVIDRDRLTAKIDGEFVVFLIGMRINKPLLPHKWMPVAAAMPRMPRELYAHPEMGFLHAGGMVRAYAPHGPILALARAIAGLCDE
jgi:hypothetical protein